MWCVRFDDRQLQALRGLIKAQGDVGPALMEALESLELARWDDLPDAGLPWDEVRKAAGRQGVGEADIVWDLAGRRPERRVPRLKKRRRQRTKKSKARTARRRK